MPETQDTQQRRGNLLDKFIRNEQKAKIWAVLSLIAFCVTASTVIVVAYQLKNGKDNVQTETKMPEVIHDSVQTVVITEDRATAALINDQEATIRLLTDSIKDLQVKYQERLQEVKMYIGLWKECENKLTSVPPSTVPPKDQPPVQQPVSVMIYAVRASNDALEKIKEFVRQSGASKSGYVFNNATAPATNTNLFIKQVPVIVAKQDPAAADKKLTTPVTRQLTRQAATQPTQKYFTGIKYFDEKFAGEAAAIAYTLNNNGKAFGGWQQLNISKGTTSATKADIEIRLFAIAVNSDIK